MDLHFLVMEKSWKILFGKEWSPWRVLNAAARLIGDTWKYDQGLSQLMHQDLHWLDIPERVSYKLVSMSPREGSSVPVGLLYTSIPSCYTTTPAFSRSSQAGGSATSAQHIWPSGIRCRWPDDLQHSAGWAARPHHQHNNFPTTFKDTFFLELSTRLAH